MIPRVRRIVANRARSLDRRLLQCVVEAANAADGDRPCVEDLLTPRDSLTRLLDTTDERLGGHLLPCIEYREGAWIERRAGGIQSDGIVDADEKWFPREGGRAAARTRGGQLSRVAIVNLSREQVHLEFDNLTKLFVCRTRRGLGVPKRRCARLQREIANHRLTRVHFAAIPHKCAQETQVGTRQRQSIHRQFGG